MSPTQLPQETPSIIPDASGTNPRTLGPQSVNEAAIYISPILSAQSRGQILEMPRPSTFAPGIFNGNFGNRAGAIPDFHARAGYNQVGKLMV